jgi:hypothetical protein
LTINNLNFECDWRFGFNIDSSRKGTVGYVLLWSGCGGLTLAKDIEVWNPFSSVGQTVVSGAKIECVALIDKFVFAGGVDDPIRLSTFVSKGAAANVRAKQAGGIASTKLKVAWYIVSFDEEKKTWYEAAFPKGGKVDSVIDTQNGVLQLFVATNPTSLAEHLDVQVYGLDFQIVPAEGKTAALEFATGPATRVMRSWGDAGE